MSNDRLEDAIAEAASRFVAEIITLLRGATIEEIAGLSPAPQPTTKRRPGRPRKTPTATAAPDVQRVVKAAQGTAEREDGARAASEGPTAIKEKAKPKRRWPTCSVEGCTGKMYGPSASNRMCYQHHRDGGGAASPFARKRKAKPVEDAVPKQRKTIRRKAGETGPTEAEAADKIETRNLDPKKKRAEVLAELERGGRKP